MTQWDADLIRRFGGAGPRYTSYPPATQFHEEVNGAEFERALAAGNRARRPLSLYCHIPFCGSVCYYCACNRIVTANRRRAIDYLADLKREIRAKAAMVDSQRPVVQMHWGGGTPTYLDDAQITELVYDLARHFRLLEDGRGDYAMEIDPRTVDRSRLGLIRGLGFNRLSIGIQDLDPRVQEAVNRVQPPSLIQAVIDNARDFGFRSINADMIYGLPWQSETRLARSLEALIEMGPDRISMYNYAHMPSRFKVQKQISEAALPSPAEKLAMLVRAGKMLEDAGYQLIGMDHFALPGDDLARARDNRSLHRNFQGYTLNPEADLLGFGVSAISDLRGLYAQNHKDIGQWRAALEDGRHPIERGFVLGADDRLRRWVINALLCDLAVDLVEFRHVWGQDFADYFYDVLPQLAEYENLGLLRMEGNRLLVTDSGRLVLRGLAMPFDRYLPTEAGERFSRII